MLGLVIVGFWWGVSVVDHNSDGVLDFLINEVVGRLYFYFF